ncbi:MAG: sensor histidine kinase [Opitutaceae bacterium]|nr:sensor histidine kinase [Opitutaceae bacterium]
MDSTSTVASLVTDAGSRRRAKERLYVVCQAAGWLGLLMLQLLFVRLFATERDPSDSIPSIVQTIAEGWLITHLVRRWLARWGWKDLGWRRLAPRILGMAVVLSAIWAAVSFGICYGLLRNPLPAKYHPLAILALNLMNGTILMAGWLCIYFFYHLFDRYNRLQIEQLRLTAAVKEAELRALKSQINPHFIFNSLNSLRGLIDEDPDRARQAVTQLANLLRYSLQSGQLETVPFEEELHTVNDYLALEQVRHEERLRVRLDVAPGALALPIPPMLLQTLVENAVKYGIAPRREGGEIAIIARCEHDQLRLQVTNPGTLAAGGGSTGVGVRNAADRLGLLFGAQATLDLREDPPGHVVAEVILPLETTPIRESSPARNPPAAGPGVRPPDRKAALSA